MFIVNGVSGALLHCINFRVATDPACGSGNFLTETYLSLRRLENEALSLLYKGQRRWVDQYTNPIKVTINQLYGIEINDFAVAVANTALFIAENQMMRETEEIMQMNLDFLPLQYFDNIHEGNALRIDWNEVISSSECNYIMGNPPFIGHQRRTKEQIEDMKISFHDLKKHGKLDYVCAWYNKAVDYMKGSRIETAFVSTNSIVQGEIVPILWKFLIEKGVIINFAYQSFIWANETKNSAHVYCVIIGFSLADNGKSKRIFTLNESKEVNHINGYLYDAPDIFIKSRGKPPKNYPIMSRGSQPTDGGFLIYSLDEKNKLLKKHPEIKDLFKLYISGQDFLNNNKRYCLWLVDIPPSRYSKIREIKERLDKVSKVRKKSPTLKTREQAKTPGLFTQIRQPLHKYIAFPETSSEKREYIPLDYLDESVIASNSLRILDSDSLYLFGILNSNVHNYWIKVIAGRLEMRYRYSPYIYNNFPFPKPEEKNKKIIEKTAQGILEARKNHPDWSLAELYGLNMPNDLKEAHIANDKAVMEAYGFKENMTENEIVSELMRLYSQN